MFKLIYLFPACFLSVIALCGQTESRYSITWNGQRLTPPPGVDTALASRLRDGGAAKVHVIVQFHAVPGDRERTALAVRGLALHQYLGGNSYLAAVAANSEAGLAAAQGTLSGVRGVLSLRAESKLSERLRGGGAPVWARAGNGEIDVEVVYHADLALAEAEAAVTVSGGRVLRRSEAFQRLTARIPLPQVKRLAEQEAVAFVDSIPAPFQTKNNTTSAAMMKVDTVNASPYGLNGTGIRVGIWDSGLVADHPELAGRLRVMDTDSWPADHATHVAGTIAASGRYDARVRGMAPGALLYSYTYDGDVAGKMLSARRDHGVEISHNSWGEYVDEMLDNCGDYGGYSFLEHDLDRLVREQGLSIVYAMGNDRSYPGCVIPPRNGFFTVGRPAAAKNVIAVGAVDTGFDISTFSNIGPARDGRLKPDVVALGVGVRSLSAKGSTMVGSGTSMSAPAVSGLLALLRERFHMDHPEMNPSPAMLKAVVLNTARDIGNPGPDYTFGYGIPDAQAAVAAVDAWQYWEGTAASGRELRTIEVPPGAEALRVMLAWSDQEAAPEAYPSLVNDLDLQVTAPDGTVLLPLTLDPARPPADAAPGVNRRDPVEQVLLRRPAAGTYTVGVLPASVPTGSQAFAVTWSFAPSEIPPCTTTFSTPQLELEPQAGTAIIDVMRANQCSEWTLASDSDWMTVPEGTKATGSAVVKVGYSGNDSGGERHGKLTVDDRAVVVTQAPTCVTAPIEPGSSIPGELTTADCLFEGSYSKMYTFSGKAGDGVIVDLTSREFDPFLGLLGPDGSAVAYNDDSSFATLNARIPASGVFVLPATGQYTIVATSYDYEGTGGFTVSLTSAAPVSIGGPVPAPVAIAGCPAIVEGALRPESSRLGRRGEMFYTDVYTFAGRVGQTLNVSIPEAAFDTVLYLVGPYGETVAFNDDAGNTALSSLSKILVEEGEYRIEVTSFGPLTAGTYKLAVEGCAAPEGQP